MPKNKIFSISAKKEQGLELLFHGIEENLFKYKIKENIILDACETEKIKWLYQNQLVEASEIFGNSIKLELIWDRDERKRFSKNFAETVL